MPLPFIRLAELETAFNFSPQTSKSKPVTTNSDVQPSTHPSHTPSNSPGPMPSMTAKVHYWKGISPPPRWGCRRTPPSSQTRRLPQPSSSSTPRNDPPVGAGGLACSPAPSAAGPPLGPGRGAPGGSRGPQGRSRRGGPGRGKEWEVGERRKQGGVNQAMDKNV